MRPYGWNAHNCFFPGPDIKWHGKESMDEARELLKDHPHLAWTPECDIVVHESLPTPGT
jgi:hypothetical protein